MQTYGQNTTIPSIGLLSETVDTLQSLPVGGYTIDYLKENFDNTNLAILKVQLDYAQSDAGQTYQEISRSNATNKLILLDLLRKIDNDLQISINNIEDILNPPDPGDPDIVLTAPVINVKGINFNSIQIGEASSLPIVVSNTGTGDLIITGYTGFGVGAAFNIISPSNWQEISSQTPLKLQPNESKSLDVVFSPLAAVEYTVNVKFVTDKPVDGTNVAVIKGSGKPIIDPGVDSILGKKKPNTKRILTLKNVRELTVKTKNNPDINSPYFDQQLTTNSAKIVADIWQCYTPYGQDKQIQAALLKDVVIGEGIGSFWYEKCDDFLGGLKPSYQYYYNLEQVIDTQSWKSVNREQYQPFGNQGLGNTQLGISTFDIESNLTFGRYLNKIKEELDSNDSYWGKFDTNNPNKTLCEPGTVSDATYISNVIRKEFSNKDNVKIYGGFRENVQTRSSSLTNAKNPDLISRVEGNFTRELDKAFISKNAFGRLNCLQPKTGCYIKDEKPLSDVRPFSDEVIKLITKATLPEKIPDSPCYRGYKATYIRSFNWERRWEVILDCLGVIYTEYEWRIDETLFTQRGTIFDVWEEVEFAGTEIGFSENCIPIEKARIQEPYVDMSDNLGCYELQTTKIYMKYADYNAPGDRNFIKGPEVLSTQDYSGLGPGIKLNRKVKRADCDQSPIRIFHPLKMGSDIITGRDNLVTKGLFNGSQSPNSYFTSSLQNEESKKYIYNVVDNNVLNCNNPISYFSVAYGNKNGSGSVYSGYEINDSTTKAIYSQNRLLALDTSETEFKTYTSGTLTPGRSDIYLINFNRNSLSDRLDPGNFEIALSDLTPTSKVMTFIDNSTDLLDDKFSNEYVFSSFDIVSGSLEYGIHDSGTGSLETNPYITTYGKVYPALGLIVFDAEKLDENLSFGTNLSENIDGNNAIKIFNSISGAAELGNGMKARSSQNKKSNHYFVRVSSGTSNYSNNPTMVSETLTNNNVIKHEFFKYNPITYITTVGLYNDSEELLAVAKLSKPVKKTSETDILIKIRLNW